MSIDHLESDAFHRATLNSEWYRIVGLLGVLAALMVYTFVRGTMVGGFRLLWIQTAFLALVMAHELQVLLAVRKALRTDKEVSRLRGPLMLLSRANFLHWRLSCC